MRYYDSTTKHRKQAQAMRLYILSYLQFYEFSCFEVKGYNEILFYYWGSPKLFKNDVYEKFENNA